MRIFIITMDDPIITNPFIKKIINFRKKDIIGVAKAKGNRTKTFQKSKLEYIFCLFWILGPSKFFSYLIYNIIFKLELVFFKLISKHSKHSILHFCKSNNIPTYQTDNVNSLDFKKTLSALKPDIIINQSQQILGQDVIKIPKFGVLNRHNSLLPRHKGRITPFWVILNRDKKTGVSIHFVDEKIDAGKLVYQFSYLVNGREFNDIVRTNYIIAPLAMLKAIDIIEQNKKYSKPISEKSNYNSTPCFGDLVKFLKIKYGKGLYT